ncbi:MAG: beta-lactamase family protein [Bacteroidota bacterium]|nr:beta-lactamase family protein [Bacteroidota bacterium]
MKYSSLFYLIFFLFGPVVINGQAEALRGEIEKIIRYETSVDYNVVPGILVGVIDGDSTFKFSFGNDINIEGVFEMGSVSKPISALLIQDALSMLNFKTNTSICSFLPDTLCVDNWSRITFEQIINHQAGLMRLAPGIGEIETDVRDPYQHYNLMELIHDIKEINPVPGRYSYSHMGYAMSYWLFEKVGGLKAFTENRFTGPLRLNHTTWDLQHDLIATGHGLDGRVQPPWHTNALTPALGLKSSLDDVLQIIRIFNLRYEESYTKVSDAGINKELKTLAKRGSYKVIDGWFVIRYGKNLVYYHNGRTGGHHVSIAFTPHLLKGVVVIANGAMGSNDLSLLILRMVNKAKRKSS